MSKTKSNSPVNWVLKQTEPIQNYYTLGARLGQPGQFGQALLATHKVTGAVRAVKVISKARFTRHSDVKYHFEQLRSEIEVMRLMNHPNIIKLYEVYESASDLYLVMECASGGELFDRIKDQGAYSEKDASNVLRQMCEGIKYMHENKIAHCDLKPDNFLFADKSPTAALKIIDFGMSKFVQRRKYFKVICGTPYYCAPEVIQGKYSEHCDIWSLGVVMFVMLFGYPPFYADQEKYGSETDERIFKLIQSGFQPVTKAGYGPHFPASIPASDSAKDLIVKLLSSDIAKRLTAAEALEHPWLTGKTASDKPVLSNVLSNLKNFQANCKFKAAVLNMMSTSMSEDEISVLKKTFRDIDENGDGTITLSELKKALTKSGSSVEEVRNTAELESIMKIADLNGDGVLSYDELLVTCVQKKMQAKEERIWEAFCKLDLDGDGKVSVEELTKVLTHNSQDAKALIAEVDVDGDGNVSYEEFIAMWTKREDTAGGEGPPAFKF